MHSALIPEDVTPASTRPHVPATNNGPPESPWQVFESVPYWRMNPEPSWAVGGTCLSDRSATMLCLAEGKQQRAKERRLILNLTAFAGPLEAEWINTWTGERKPAGKPAPAVTDFAYPDEFGGAPALLLLRR